MKFHMFIIIGCQIILHYHLFIIVFSSWDSSIYNKLWWVSLSVLTFISYRLSYLYLSNLLIFYWSRLKIILSLLSKLFWFFAFNCWTLINRRRRYWYWVLLNTFFFFYMILLLMIWINKISELNKWFVAFLKITA